MNSKLIGVATSISKDKNYDPLDTLQFSLQNNIKLIQIYLNYELIHNKPLIREIHTFAQRYNKIITCHSPEFLNRKCIADKIISTANQLMNFQREKRIIIHFDEKESITNSLEYVKKLNKADLSVCVENYYQRKDEISFINTINNYNSLLVISKKLNLTINPVIDLPRLFIADIFNQFNSLFLCKQLCSLVAELNLPVTIHLIDFKNYNQKRNCWCTLGEGLMPYKEIFSFMNKIKINLDHFMFEFENKEMFLSSIKVVNKMFSI